MSLMPAAKISIICEKAFTRQPEIPWERIAKPLSATFRKLIMVSNAFDEGYQRRPTKQPDRHRRKARAVMRGSVFGL